MRIALVAFVTVFLTGCVGSGYSTSLTTGAANGYQMKRSGSLPDTYLVRDRAGRSYECRGQTGRASRVQFENAMADNYVATRRPDVARVGLRFGYVCRR